MCVKWYRKWHQKWYSHHVHAAVLGLYVFTIIFSLIFGLLPGPQVQKAQAASGNWGQTTFNGTSDGTYSNTVSANSGADLGLKSVGTSTLSNNGTGSWVSRRAINLTNSSGASQSNYQVPVTPFADSSFVNLTNLNASWHFNEGSGTIIHDKSGNSLTGTLNSASAWATDGYDKSIDTTSGAYKVTVADATALNPTNITVEAWIKPSLLTQTNGVIVDKRAAASPYNGYALAINTNGVNSIGFWAGNNSGWLNGSFAWDTNWHFVVATYNGTNAQVYVDGNSVAGPTAKSGNIVSTGTGLTIGNSQVSGTSNFQGKIDEVKIFGRTMASPEVSTLYNSGTPIIRPDFEDLRFANTAGTTEYSYWQQTDATYWVKVSDAIPTGASSINLYYNNPKATASSSGSGTFAFFSEFNNGATDGWTNFTSTASEYGYHTETVTGATTTTHLANTSNFTAPSNAYLDIALNQTSAAAGDGAGGSHSEVLRVNKSGVYTNLETNDMAWTNKNYSLSSFAGQTISLESLLSVTGTSANIPDCDTKGCTDHWYYYGYTLSASIDNVRVRNYVANGPAYSSIGTESSAAYASSGSFISLIAPDSQYPAQQNKVYSWGNLTFARDVSGAGSALTVQVLTSGGSLVPDAALTGNSTGFTSSPVSLAGLSTITYPSLKIQVNLSTSNVSNSPYIRGGSGGLAVAYSYDSTAPTGTALSWGTITATSAAITPSGATDSESGLSANPYYIECDYNATSFVTADYNSGWTNSSWSFSPAPTPNTAYACRAKARDNDAKLASPNISGWVTPSPAYKYTLTNAPTSPAANAVSTTQINLSWSPPASGGVSSYHLYSLSNGYASPVYSGTGTSTSESSLTANSNYTYYVCGVNGDGVDTFSGTKSACTSSFSMHTLPGAPSTLATTSVKGNEIDLSWTAPTGGADHYHLYQNGSQVGGDISGAATTYNSTGLNGSTLYTFWLKAVNGYPDNVEGASSNTVSATTSLGAPISLSSAASTTTQINLSWAAPSGQTPDHYHLYRTPASGGALTKIEVPGTSYSDTGLSDNTGYVYYVKAVSAVDPGGTEGAASASITRYTYANIPTTLTAASVSNSEIDLTWPVSTGNGASFYHLYRIQGASTTQIGNNISGSTTFYADNSGLASNTAYTYKIYSVNADSPAVESAAFTSTSAPVYTRPDKPTSVTATAISASQINLTWGSMSGISTYHLFRNGSQIGGTIATNSYNDTAVPVANNQYSYTVRAVNSSGESADSDLAVKYSLANAPASIAQTAIMNNEIDLSWPAASGSVGAYHLYRIQGANTTQIGGNIASGTLSYQDTGLSQNTTYSYKIYGANSDSPSVDSSSFANTSSLVTLADRPVSIAATGVSTSEIDLSWAAVTGVTTYHLFRGGIQIGGDIHTNSYNDTSGLSGNTSYTYYVKAGNGVTDSAASDSVTRYTLTNAPGSITATLSSSAPNSEIDLSWTAASGSVGAYHLYRVQGANTTQIGGNIASGNLSYQDTGLNPNTNYTYKIYTINSDSPAVESAGYATTSRYTMPNTPTIENIATPTNNNKPAVTNNNHPDGTLNGRTVRLYIDGTDDAHWYNNLTATASAGVFNFNFGSFPLADGAHTVTVKVVSQSGDLSPSSNTDSIFVDTATPTTSVSINRAGPAAGVTELNGYMTTAPTFTLSVSDPAPSGGNGTTYWRWNSDVYQIYSSPITNMAEGTQTLWWYTTDSAGNIETAHSQQYKLDTALPSGTISLGTNGYVTNHLTPLTLSATDVTSGIYQMQFSNDGATFSPWETYATTKTAWDLTSLSYGGSITEGPRTVYVRYKDIAGNITASISSSSVSFDTQAPTNPSATGKASASDNTVINTGEWHNYSAPKFTLNGATDPGAPTNGSGLDGYWVYFGTDNSAIPNVAGSYQAAATFTPILQSSDSGNTFYLRVQSQDKAGNLYTNSNTTVYTLFTYKFDNTAPATPAYIDVVPPGTTTVDNFDFSWPAVTDQPGGTNSGVYKYQYKRETDLTWTDTGNGGADTFINGVHKYRSGSNIFLVQVLDNARNVSASQSRIYYYSDPAALVPANLTADTSQSVGGTVNNFKFTWDPVPNVARYYFSSNSTPSETSSFFDIGTLPMDTHVTINGQSVHLTVGSDGKVALGPFASASKTDLNTFYVVAMDNGGNGDWTDPAQASYSVNTHAPDAPTAVTISDASNRSASMYALTVMWPPISNQTPDFSGYQIEKSSDGTVYTPVATVKTNIYSEAGLTEGQLYYYRVRSIDNTGNTSSTYVQASRIPTGKYTTPPTITDDPKVTVKATSVNITWHTNRSANSIVQFGPGNGYGQEISQATTYTFDHSIDLAGLTPGLQYHFRVASIDKDYDYSEDAAFSGDYTFTTLAAPGISNVTTSEIRLYSAIVTWKTTSSATSRILYGTSNSYGQTYDDSSGSQTTTHTVKLDNLNDSTTYHYKIQGMDVDGNILTSDDYVFTTLTFPKVSNLSVTYVAQSRPSTTKVTFDTNVSTSALVSFVGVGGKDVSNYNLTQSHTLNVTGLTDDTAYTVTVKGRDQYGDESLPASVSYHTPFDTTPPLITDVTTETSILGYGVDAKAQVVVSWNTDKSATSQVEYGPGVGSNDYNSRTQEDTSLTVTHVVIISDLKPSAPYHFRVVSVDHAGNIAKSSDNSLLTEQASESVLDLIIKSLQSSIGWIFTTFTRGS